ncbi:hypothetical protein [Gordonia aichiensis]
MSTDCAKLESAFEAMRSTISCRMSHDGATLIVTSGRSYADGDHVEVLVRLTADGERIAVSDGGLTRTRLDLHGTEIASATATSLWRDVLDEYGVAEIGDRVYARGPIEHAAGLIGRVADASVALDSVQLLTAGERRGFASKLQNWLETDAGFTIHRGETVRDRYGDEQRVTAVVEAPRGEILVQAVGGRTASKMKAPIEHASWILGGLNEHEYPLDRRLVVLEGLPNRVDSVDRVRGWVRRLSAIAYVGSFEAQLAVSRFLREDEAPPTRDFALESYGQLPTE